MEECSQYEQVLQHINLGHIIILRRKKSSLYYVGNFITCSLIPVCDHEVISRIKEIAESSYYVTSKKDVQEEFLNAIKNYVYPHYQSIEEKIDEEAS